jgi:hypothetical protein
VRTSTIGWNAMVMLKGSSSPGRQSRHAGGGDPVSDKVASSCGTRGAMEPAHVQQFKPRVASRSGSRRYRDGEACCGLWFGVAKSARSLHAAA